MEYRIKQVGDRYYVECKCVFFFFCFTWNDYFQRSFKTLVEAEEVVREIRARDYERLNPIYHEVE